MSPLFPLCDRRLLQATTSVVDKMQINSRTKINVDCNCCLLCCVHSCVTPVWLLQCHQQNDSWTPGVMHIPLRTPPHHRLASRAVPLHSLPLPLCSRPGAGPTVTPRQEQGACYSQALPSSHGAIVSLHSAHVFSKGSSSAKG